MKKNLASLIFVLLTLMTHAFCNTVDLKADFTVGNPDITSINAMTFGPQGILFIGDSKSAEIIAIDLSDHAAIDNSKVGIKNLDGLIADMLGGDADQVQVTDLAVNPENNNIYISVHHSSGKALLLQVVDNTLKQVSLNKISHSKTAVMEVVAEDAKDRRGRSLRKWAISDIHYDNQKVMLSGLSSQEFASTFRSIEFPFNKKQMHSSLEIYHAAHGKYETHAPIKTFTTTQVNGKPHVIASYTCTPLVLFPMDQLTPGEHSKGKTIAELGNWNTPLGIIEMEKGGNRYILIANSSRALMKINVTDIEKFGNSLDSKVEVRSGTAGVEFINLPFVNVQHLDKLGDNQFLMIQRDGNGDLVLKTGSDRWL